MAVDPDPRPLFVPAESVLSTGFFNVEPTRTMQADGYPWEHEIRVALPLSYAESTRAYPVLWVTDNVLETALAVLGPVELIVVSIGAPRNAGGFASARRAYDFYPCEDIYPPDPAGAYIRAMDVGRNFVVRGGGAAQFLDFLVDTVRPALAADYRMDERDQAIEGYSAGGWFVVYALFQRPGAFAKYLAGAPALYFCSDLIWQIEEDYAERNDDLTAQLFFGAGDRELAVEFYFGCFSSMAKMVERLSLRSYASLVLDVRIFPGESHLTGRPFAISAGVHSLWGDAIVRRS
jgi:predicted alpha/beta superfamily hydrolase